MKPDGKKTALALLITGLITAVLFFWFRAGTPATALPGIRFVETGSSARSGYLPSVFEASEGGAPVYEVPIDVPPGTNGVAPELAFSYANIRSNGILGVGWQLEGLSSITRTGQIMPVDSQKTGITFTDSDRFMLNSQRLVPYKNAAGKLLTTVAERDAAQGKDGTEYRTELESWTRVFSYGNSGSGPTCFIAYAKDGSVMQFGTSPDARIRPANAMAVVSWGLNKIADRNGNYVEIEYTAASQQGVAVPEAIRYTGNSRGKLRPQRLVRFNYSKRGDSLISYMSGVKISGDALLKDIRTYVDRDGDGNEIDVAANLVKTYSLVYAISAATGRAVLDSMYVKDAAGNALPATRFTRTDFEIRELFSDTIVNLPEGFSKLLNNPNATMRADFTGDGLPDIALLETNAKEVVIASFGQDCSIRMLRWPVASTYSRCFNNTSVQTLPGDYNGDGLTDIAFFEVEKQTLQVLITRKNGGFEGVNIILSAFPKWIFSSLTKLLPADYNGDGLTDFAAFSTGQQSVVLMLANPNLTFTPVNFILPLNVSNLVNSQGAKQMPGDYNGDGLTDIAIFNTSWKSIPVLFSMGASGFNCTVEKLPDNVKEVVNASGSKQVQGDFNGDGLCDFAIFNSGNIKLPLLLSRGNGSFAIQLLESAEAFNKPATAQVTGDMNGDGITDLIAFGSGYSTIPSFVSSGGGRFTYIKLPLSKATSAIMSANDVERFVADFNGDGMTDVAALGKGFQKMPLLVAHHVKTQDNIPDLLTGIRDGIGQKTTITYQSICDTNVYKAKGVFTYPLMSSKFPLYVVSESVVSTSGDSCAGSSLKYAYRYQSVVIDQYRGLQGFERIYVSDFQHNTLTTSIHLPEFPYSGITCEKRVADLADSSKLMQVIRFDYSSEKEQGTGVSIAWNNRTTNRHYTNGHLNFSTWQTFRYDPSHSVVVFVGDIKNNSGDSGDVFTWTKYDFSEQPDSLWWHRFFPVQQKISADSVSVNWKEWTRPDYSWIKYAYDNRMNLVRTNSYRNTNGLPGTSAWIGSSTRYDIFGNAVMTRTPPNAARDSITSELVFDSIYHTFPVRSILPDPMPGKKNPRLFTRQSYDPRFGMQVGTTDLNGIVSAYIPDGGLDGFARILILQSASPVTAGLATRSVFSYGAEAGTGYTITSRQPQVWTAATKPGEDWVKTIAYYDGFARNYRTASNGYSKQVQLIDQVKYDSAGRIINEFQPFYFGKAGIQYSPGGPVYTSARSQRQVYDSHGLLKDVFVPEPNDSSRHFLAERITYDKADDRISYTWRPSPADDAVLIYWKNVSTGSGLLIHKSGPYNADGSKAVNFSEAAYRYDPLGRLVTIIDPLGEKLLTAYNSLSNVVMNYRPETDTIRYVFNSNGWQTSEISASGKVTAQYDDLGRLLLSLAHHEKEPADTIAGYVYDDVSIAPNSRGALSQKKLKQGVYTYSYSPSGELLRESFQIYALHKTYEQQFRTDPFGRVDTLIDPEGSLTIYRYDAMGNMRCVLTGGDTLLRYTGYTASGDALGSVARNGVISAYSYDNLGNERSASVSKGAFVMRSYRYDWNHAAKLTAINDTRKKKETDLSQHFRYLATGRLCNASGAYGNETFSYDAGGNRIADGKYIYQYDKVKKHQLTGISRDGKQLFGFRYTKTGELEEKTISGSFLAQTGAADTSGARVYYDFDVQGNMEMVMGAAGKQARQPVDRYFYDDEGNRICKQDSDQTVTWYISPFFETVKLKTGELLNTWYVYGNSQVIFAKTGTSLKPAADNGESGTAKAVWWLPFFHINGGIAVHLPVFAGYLLAFFVLLTLLRGVRVLRATHYSARPGFAWKPVFFAAVLLAVLPASAAPAAGANGPGVPVAGEERFFSHDQVGSISLLTDKAGGLTNSIEYRPFGSIDEHLSSGEDNFRPKFTGKEYDAYTGLYYFGARYYDSDLGRFISPDPAAQFFSPYSYGDGDPLSGTDPDGNAFGFIMALVIGAIAGMYVGASLANDSFNPGNWEWNSAKTWTGMISGAAAAVSVVASGGMALVAMNAVTAESVALGSMSAATLASGSLDISFITSDLYAFADDPTFFNGLFAAIDIIPFAKSLGKSPKKSIQAGEKTVQREIEMVPMSKETDNLAQHTVCPFSLAAETAILTPGGEKRLADIAVGDEVIAADTESGENGTYAVTRIFRRIATGLLFLVTAAGDTLAITPEHPVFTSEAGWAEAKQVQPGQHLFTAAVFGTPVQAAGADGTIAVKAVRFIPDTILTVYNFEVEQVHNYYAGISHILVHNPEGCGKAGVGGAHGNTKGKSEYRKVESNHFPASDSYTGTPYAGISRDKMPAVTMLYDDHRMVMSTGGSHDSKAYRNIQRDYLKKEQFAMAMKMDIVDMMSYSLNSKELKQGIIEAIHYAYKYKHKGKRLISSDDRTMLMNVLAKF